MQLAGKIAFITGAGSGFGRELALQLADQGCVVHIADVNEQALAETRALVESRGGKVRSYTFDVRDAEAFASAAEQCVARDGGVDVLINNAGVLSRNVSFLEMDLEHQRFVFDVNFWGMVNGARAFVPHLAKRERASLVNVASSLAVCGAPFHSAYCAAKAAILQYSRVMRQELGRRDIVITVVLPGAAKTNLGANVSAISSEEKDRTVANFNRFARTSAETVARKVIHAIRKGKGRVITGADGKLSVWLGQAAPGFAHRLMGWAYRKVGEPEQYRHIDSL